MQGREGGLGQILSVSDGGKHRRRNRQGGVCERVCVDNPEGELCSGGVGDGGMLGGGVSGLFRPPSHTSADTRQPAGQFRGRAEQVSLVRQLHQLMTVLSVAGGE